MATYPRVDRAVFAFTLKDRTPCTVQFDYNGTGPYRRTVIVAAGSKRLLTADTDAAPSASAALRYLRRGLRNLK